MHPDAVTENGAPSFSTTGSARVNLFFKMTRDAWANPSFVPWLSAAFAEDPLDTLRIVFQARDCRGGKGDRAPFLAALKWLRTEHPDWFDAALPHVPFFGRFLDWVQLHAEAPSALIVRLVCEQLRADVAAMDDGGGVSLLAKWLPTEGKAYDRRAGGSLLRGVCREFFALPPGVAVGTYHLRLLRKEVVAPLRTHLRLVERAMCAGDWRSIDFSAVPSVAMNRLKKAFERRDRDRFSQWRCDLALGRVKVNSRQVDAHELVRQYMSGGRCSGPDEVIEGQWRGLVEALRSKGSLEHTLVLSDVSGSMEGTPMEVSVALGILISSACSEHFRNTLITFEERPQFHVIPPHCASLYAKVQSVRGMRWGGSTDLHAAMRLILKRARKLGLRPEEMPRRLVVLSDMQFDQAFGQADTQFERIRRKFAKAGYPVPQVVFWNLRSDTTQDFPVAHDERGVALLSGYRPVLLDMVVEAAELSPFSIMRAAIDAPRYARIVAPPQQQQPVTAVEEEGVNNDGVAE